MSMYSIFLILSSLWAHDIHISTSELNYNTKSQTLELSISLFLDDLEAAIYAADSIETRLYSQNELPQAEDYIADYLAKHVQIKVDGQLAEQVYLGKEATEDYSAVWCYVEIEGVRSGSVIEVSNTVFTEIFDDQSQIMQVSKDNKRVDYWLMNKAPFTESTRL